ncbi:hypothetical protein [Brucella intermedia]|uniref:hypothetical protein n=1 Tax=Brucella intermedia TaxID=94625 RepID=UPI00124E9F71|nr:hypothetical protein [Brucella intermedia]KAB2719504.1 hypothetical protein F9L02_23430 [Brucella intermedia]
MVGALILAGCTTTRDTRLSDAIKVTHISVVDVETTPDVATGRPMLNGKTPEEQVAIVVAALKKVGSRDLKGHPGGPNAARLILTLQRADLASEQGRVIFGSDSSITGSVRLEDMKTGRLIAQNPMIVGHNAGVKGGGSGAIGVGAFVTAMAINAVMTESQEALADKLAVSFTKNVKNWLRP